MADAQVAIAALNQYPEENPDAAISGNRFSPATPFGALRSAGRGVRRS